jgi:hypothetical protein
LKRKILYKGVVGDSGQEQLFPSWCMPSHSHQPVCMFTFIFFLNILCNSFIAEKFALLYFTQLLKEIIKLAQKIKFGKFGSLKFERNKHPCYCYAPYPGSQGI